MSHCFSVSGMNSVNSQSSHTVLHHAQYEPLSHGHRSWNQFLIKCMFNVHGVIDVIHSLTFRTRRPLKCLIEEMLGDFAGRP